MTFKSAEMKFLIDFSILLRNRNYRFLYVGQFVSFTGTVITSVALPYQIYYETQSTLMVGLLSLIQLIPMVITMLFGGVLADHYNRRKILLIAESLLAIGCLLFALNASFTEPRVWILFVVSAYMSVFSGFHWPAIGGIVQQIVEKDDFAAVGSLSSFMYSLCMIAGPAVAGLIIAYFGLVFTYLIDFASFAVSLTALCSMRNIAPPITENKDLSVWLSLKQGFLYTFNRKDLLGSYIIDFSAMVFGMPLALFPAIAQSMGGVKILGLLYSAPAVGSLVISLFSGWTKHVRKRGVGISVSALVWGIAMALFGLCGNLYAALFFLALSGAFDTISGIFRGIMWNESIPNDYRSRLSGIEMICCFSGPKLGDARAGLVAALFGVTTSVVSGGILCLISVIACCFMLPTFWKYESKQ